jgi:glycerol-3-phosphate dehydrogenase (NAD(P)+)
MEKVSVIGLGSWGTTLAELLAANGHDVLAWARSEATCAEVNEQHSQSRYLPGFSLSPNLRATPDLSRACAHSRWILLVVPSHVLRETARAMGDHLCGEHLIVHATKGIEQGTFRRMSEILREETCVRRIGVLSGPNLAKEIMRRQPAGTLVASHYREVLERSVALLHSPAFRVYTGDDVVGAEVGGAFKNIVAVAAGVVDGLGLGDNTRALLLTRGLAEMAKVGAAMGARVVTFGGLAGIGDLMATCASPLSRNHQVGERLAKGQRLEQIQAELGMVAEGVKTTRSTWEFARRHGLDLPIVRAVHGVLYEDIPVRRALDDLMALPPSHELVELAWQ